MNHQTAFLTLLTVFLLTVLTLVLSTPITHAAGDREVQTTPYIDHQVVGAPAPAVYSPKFY